MRASWAIIWLVVVLGIAASRASHIQAVAGALTIYLLGGLMFASVIAFVAHV